jgi:SAM-dependent methyltransferase
VCWRAARASRTWFITPSPRSQGRQTGALERIAYSASVDECHQESAARIRALVERARSTPAVLQAALVSVAPEDRDTWIDMVCGLGDVPDEGPDLPRGCTPYLPCSVDALLRIVEQAPVHSSDVFVDVGSGLGRAATFVHLLTGAGAIGLEIQSALVVAGRHLARRLDVSRVSTVHGDAAKLVGLIRIGTVFFLYCPFSGDRLVKVLADLEPHRAHADDSRLLR